MPPLTTQQSNAHGSQRVLPIVVAQTVHDDIIPLCAPVEISVQHVRRTGLVCINGYEAMDPGVPFGDHKQRGYGLEARPHRIEEYLKTKATWIKTA